MSLPAISPNYKMEKVLGRGGTATVYLADDLRHGRKVAIKVLSPDLASAMGSERFHREIRIAAGLVHPHIVPLIESGEQDGALFYVTPYLAGGTLRDRLDEKRRLPVLDAVRIAREIGNALDFAHRHGFLHRDVKPENILFTDDHAVLADFGIARVTEPGRRPESGVARGPTPASGLRTSPITSDGIAVGTPEYMSPEQAAGEREIGGESDLYGLACVVYEMLAGEPPLRGQGERSTMAMQVSTTPVPVRVARPEIPSRIERALVRALAKDPRDRFRSADEFVKAMESEGAMAGPPLAIGRAIAVLPFVNASPDAGNEYLSDGITDELIDALAHVDGLRVASRTSVFALKGKSMDVRAIGALLGVTWVLEGTVRRAGDRLRVSAQLTSTDEGRLLWSGRYDRTFEDVFAIQEELAHTIVTTLRARSFVELPDPAQKRYTQSVKAYGLYLKGRYAWNKRTQEGITEAIRYFEEAIAEDPGYAPAYTGLADSYSLQLDYRNVPVDEGFALAMSYARKALALDDTLAETHASLAWALFIHEWNWEESRREFTRAIQLDPRYATGHQWYTMWFMAHQELDQALVEAHTALELDPGSISVRRTVAWVYYYGRRFEQAREHIIRAIAMNPMAEENYWILGLVLSQMGEWTEAERVLREGLRYADLGTYSLATLGYVLAHAGRRAEAEEILASFVERARSEYVSPVAFAIVHIGLGNIEKALDAAEKAYQEHRGWVVYLRVNPLVDPLRKEPRFEALIARLGFA